LRHMKFLPQQNRQDRMAGRQAHPELARTIVQG
jgi:hypothetical protein